jgi:hypothetical protein
VRGTLEPLAISCTLVRTCAHACMCTSVRRTHTHARTHARTFTHPHARTHLHAPARTHSSSRTRTHTACGRHRYHARGGPSVLPSGWRSLFGQESPRPSGGGTGSNSTSRGESSKQRRTMRARGQHQQGRKQQAKAHNESKETSNRRKGVSDDASSGGSDHAGYLGNPRGAHHTLTP